MFKDHQSYKKPLGSSLNDVFKAFKNIDSTLFIAISLILILTSKVDNKLTNFVSMKFVNCSIFISKIVSSPLNLAVNLTSGLQDLIEVKKQNAILVKENEKLKSIYIQSLNIKQENKELREIVNYTNTRDINYIVARLIAQPYKTYSHNALIDAGSLQGIKEDNIVIGNNTLIGRIDQVDKNKSRVLLTTDINSHIPVIVSGTKTKGILVGNNSNLMEILYLEENNYINKGDLVFTSGDGESLPSGFLIGVIKESKKGTATVEMIENVKNLDLVTVVDY